MKGFLALIFMHQISFHCGLKLITVGLLCLRECPPWLRLLLKSIFLMTLIVGVVGMRNAILVIEYMVILLTLWFSKVYQKLRVWC